MAPKKLMSSLCAAGIVSRTLRKVIFGLLAGSVASIAA
jgi:hypothetical protein